MNIDVGAVITTLIFLAAVYFIIKFIVSPIIKLISGIVVLLIVIYVCQQFFNVSFNQYLGPLAKYIDIDQWSNNLGQLISPIISYITKAISFLNFFSKATSN